MTYEEAMALLRRYNKETFHLCHAITVSKVMRRMANELGFGESVGPWKFVDKTFRANKDQLRRAKDGKRAEAVRRARRDGTPEPELISVQQDGPASKGQDSPRK